MALHVLLLLCKGLSATGGNCAGSPIKIIIDTFHVIAVKTLVITFLVEDERNVPKSRNSHAAHA